jgi:O-antigen ligase
MGRHLLVGPVSVTATLSADTGKFDIVARFNFNSGRANWPFWMLIFFLISAFALGGGSRDDVQSLAVLRPLSVITCGLAVLTLHRDHITAHKFIFGMTAAVFALVALHLVPLPPSIWGGLPGRDIISDVDRITKAGAVWRPITMVPNATWNAFYSLFTPLAVLLLGVQLSREQRFQLLYVVLGLGLLGGLWGLMQAIGSPTGPLYLYRVTMPGAAVGLFANRNHQAILLAILLPALVIHAIAGVRTIEAAKQKGWTAVAIGVVLIPLILVTGSRAGLLVAIVALVFAGLLYRKPVIAVPGKRKATKVSPLIAIGAFAVLCLGALTILMSRAEAFRRLMAPDQSEDLRFRVWGPIVDMAWKYFPVGSGVGSFVEVFKIDEPDNVLSPNYLNHAHNDWLEVFMTAGLPGIALLAIALLAFGRMAFHAFRAPVSEGRSVLFARLGGVIIALLALGSIGDYPLRVPSLMCIFVIAMLWLTGDGQRSAKIAGGI